MRVVMVALIAVATLSAQTHTTVRHRQVEVTDESAAGFNRAQDAIAKGDFAAARTLLQQYTTTKPADYRGWYTLAYADSRSGEKPAAIEHYKKALLLKPDLFEANLNLGLLLAQSGDRTAALPYLQAAVAEKPSVDDPAQRNKALANAWDALGNLQSGEEAKASYQKALALDPQDESAKAGLQRAGAETVNHGFAKGAALSISELEGMHAQNPESLTVTAHLADAYTEAKQYAKAEPLLKQLAAVKPGDATVQYNYGVVLMNLHRPREAQNYFLKALKLDSRLSGGYGNLAIVAAQNQDYMLSMRALDARVQHLPENAGSLFLRATNLDHLQQVMPAAIMYRKYLAIAHGESPDNEWQAKHRLIALDPHNQTKGKELEKEKAK
ncbi:MAG: tetratricopeptide repeat protein [Acidobacteriaceae bacterium]